MMYFCCTIFVQVKIVIKSHVELHLGVFCSTDDVDCNFVAMARLLRVGEVLPMIMAVFFVINHNNNKIRLPPTPLGYQANCHNSQGSTSYSGL